MRAELDRQGWSAGEEPVWRGLGKSVPRARVRRVLRELNGERRARRTQHVREARTTTTTTTTVLTRDAVWSMDATHVGRDVSGAEVQAEVVREVASGRTLAASVGRPPTVST